jgi:hypothetical protein
MTAGKHKYIQIEGEVTHIHTNVKMANNISPSNTFSLPPTVTSDFLIYVSLEKVQMARIRAQRMCVYILWLQWRHRLYFVLLQ